jgi:hypothetical protein
MFTADPDSMARVMADPAFEPLGAAIRVVLHRLTVAARLEAEGRLERASAAADQNDEAGLVAYARKQFETGQYPGYWKAARVLTQVDAPANPFVLVHETRPIPLEQHGVPGGTPVRRAVVHGLVRQAVRRAALQFETLWMRLPLLALLLGWVILGIAGGIVRVVLVSMVPALGTWLPFSYGYAIWALGLLAVIVFAFLRSTIRLYRLR